MHCLSTSVMWQGTPLTFQDVEDIALSQYGQNRSVGQGVDPRVQQLESRESFELLKSVIANSTSTYAIFLCSHYLRKLLVGTDLQLSARQAVELKEFLEAVVVQRHQQGLELFCLRSLITCLSLLVKAYLLEVESLTTFPKEVLTAFDMYVSPSTLAAATSSCRGSTVPSTMHEAEVSSSQDATAPPLSSCSPPSPSSTCPVEVCPHPLALLILDSLVVNVGWLNEKRPIADHRKTAAMFKEDCIDSIFTSVIGCCRFLHHQLINARGGGGGGGGVAMPIDLSVAQQVISLLRAVLAFDYVGMIGSDDVGEEPQSMNFPSTWREVLLCPGLLEMFWELYTLVEPPLSANILQCINCLCCTRRSLFQSEEERKGWLSRILSGTMTILQCGTWLGESSECCTEFCRLLSRIKPNYQLNEFLEVPCYEQWMCSVSQFTVDAFANWRHTSQGIGYLCTMWSRLIGSEQYARKGNNTFFELVVPRVTMSYLQSRMDIATTFASSSGSASSGGRNGTIVENPLDDAGEDFRLQLEAVAVMLRYCLRTIVADIAELFRAAASASVVVCQSDPVAEEKLAWLLFLFGSLLRSPAADDDYDADALMISSCFEVIELTKKRTGALHLLMNRGSSLEHLELGSLHFLHCFRSTYVGEPTNQANRTMARLQEKLGLSHMSFTEMQTKLLAFLMDKIVSNLQASGDSTHVLDETLRLFKELSTGFSSGRQLLELQAVKYLLSPEGAHEFPFQRSAAMHRHRVKYRHTTTSVLFLDSVSPQQWQSYMQPLTSLLAELRACSMFEMLQQPSARDTVIGVLCDLRGVCTACIGKRNYHMLFDSLFPTHLETLLMIADVDTRDDKLETQLLRLSCELCYNRCQRISFDAHSAGGFHLFFYLCRLITAIGNRKVERILQLRALGGQQQQQQQCSERGSSPQAASSLQSCMKGDGSALSGDPHEWLVKGSQLIFQLAHYGLSGAYCNFGVLALYNDTKLSSVLHVVWRLMVLFHLGDLVSCPKVAKDYFLLLEQLFALHCDFVASADPDEILHVLHILEGSMQAVPIPAAALNAACSALHHLCKHLITSTALPQQQMTNNDGGARAAAFVSGSGSSASPSTTYVIGQVLHQRDPGYLERLLNVVFSNVLYDEGTNQWTLSQPLLPLILLNSAGFDALAQQCIVRGGKLAGRGAGDVAAACQQQRVREAFEKLMDGVERNLERKSRDKFQQNLTPFRHAVKQFL